MISFPQRHINVPAALQRFVTLWCLYNTHLAATFGVCMSFYGLPRVNQCITCFCCQTVTVRFRQQKHMVRVRNNVIFGLKKHSDTTVVWFV